MNTAEASGITKGRSLWSKGFTLLFILTIFDQNAFISIRTIFTAYVQNDLSFTYSMAGMLTGVISIASLFARPFAGRLLGGKLNHKHILVTAEICSAAIIPLYLLFTSYPLMVLIRLLHGFFYGVTSTCAVTMASNTLPREHMGVGMGTFGIGTMVTLGLSPTIAVEIYNRLGASSVFIFCCATAAIALTLSFLVPSTMPALTEMQKSAGEARGLRRLFLKRSIPPSMLNFASQFTYASISAFIVVYGGSRGWAQIGAFYLVYSFGSFFARPITGKIYDRHGITPVVYLSTASFIIGIFMLALTTNFYICLLSSLFCCLGFGGGWCVYQADALNCDNPADRGRAGSTYFMFNDIGAFLGAMAAGYVVSLVGYSGTFMIFTIPLFATLALYSAAQFARRKNMKVLDNN